MYYFYSYIFIFASYFSKRDPDQIRSVVHVHGASADVPDWILSNRQVRAPEFVAH